MRHVVHGTGAVGGQCQGRVVARQLDDLAVVIRVPFDVRDALVQQAPGVFSIPPRFAEHMMVVAALSADDADLVEQALTSAWRLQNPPASAGR